MEADYGRPIRPICLRKALGRHEHTEEPTSKELSCQDFSPLGFPLPEALPDSAGAGFGCWHDLILLHLLLATLHQDGQILDLK